MEQVKNEKTSIVRALTSFVCLGGSACAAYELMALMRASQDELANLLFVGLPFMLLFELVAAISGIALLLKALFLLIAGFLDKESFSKEIASFSKLFSCVFIVAAVETSFTRMVVHDFLWSWTTLVILAILPIALLLLCACVEKERLATDLLTVSDTKVFAVVLLVACGSVCLLYLLSLCPNMRTITFVRHTWRWVFGMG